MKRGKKGDKDENYRKNRKKSTKVMINKILVAFEMKKVYKDGENVRTAVMKLLTHES